MGLVQVVVVLALLAFLGIMGFRLFRTASTQIGAARSGPAAWAAAAPALGFEVPQPGKLYLKGTRDGRAVTIIGDRAGKNFAATDLTAPTTGDPHVRLKEFWTTTEVAFLTRRDPAPNLRDLPTDLFQMVRTATKGDARLRSFATGLQLSRPGVTENAEDLERDVAFLCDLAARIETLE